jgi:ATP-dependent DNA ligase
VDAILDDEVVCLDGGRQAFFRGLFPQPGTPDYVAFDLLWLDGRDLRDLPLSSARPR